jgi:hypothetical protein
VAVTLGIIWLFYGFRFSAFAPEFQAGADFNNGWGWTLTGIGLPGRVIWWLKEWRVLPEAWLYGLAFVLNFSRARGAFMSGDYSITGWVSFFPFAFIIKTTVPLLLLIGSGIGCAIVQRLNRRQVALRSVWARVRPILPLVVLFVVYWATSLSSNLNIGHRHILPTYPVLFILVGWLGRWLDRRHSVAALAIVGATVWHVGESLAVRPHYLAYFNQVVGGPENGWRHLVDSSLDWGQDLPGLKGWLDRHARGEQVYLSYFGTGDPLYEGIRATALPTLPEVGPPRRWYSLEPGIYAVSATMLQHVYSRIRGPWTIDLEREFQEVRAMEPTLLDFHRDPVRREALLREAPAENWKIAWQRFEQLRFARLCHYLRVRQPDAMIGYSILVYRLSADEIAAGTGESLQRWSTAIEQAVARRQESP